MTEEKPTPDDAVEGSDRRGFLGRVSGMAMGAGLLGGYGAFALIAGRYLYPARRQDRRWLFVAEEGQLGPGDSLLYRGPAGETINIARQGDEGSVDDFVALSSTCPHLGCKVHWESQNNRFFCPCHNGVFDPSGKGISGPPGDAGQSLSSYPLKVEGGLLYIEVPLGQLADLDQVGTIPADVATEEESISAPGHDPCLSLRGRRA